MLLNKWMRLTVGRPMAINQLDFIIESFGDGVKGPKSLLEEWSRHGRLILTSGV
jgi:hypothetical protein